MIILDSTDSKMIENNSQIHQANMSTAARTTFPASRAGSKKKAPKHTSKLETSTPSEPKQEEIVESDEDIAHHLYETIKCVGCFQPPVSPKQCVSCQNLMCGNCLESSNKCISCGSSSFGPVKDKILLMILDKFVLFTH